MCAHRERERDRYAFTSRKENHGRPFGGHKRGGRRESSANGEDVDGAADAEGLAGF